MFFLHLVLSFLQLATLLLNFTYFLSENVLNKLLLAKPTVLKNIPWFKRITIIIWLTKYEISRGGSRVATLVSILVTGKLD